MAWSVKLQSGSGGVQGYNEWQAVYNPADQTALKLKYGFSLGNQAPDVLFHTPDNGAPIPVRANGANRLLFLTVDIPASATWDSVTGLVNTLARLVDGPDSQAVRAQTAGDVDKVRVAIKPNGATYTTYFEVLTGFMDTSTAFTEPAAVINTVGRNVTLALTCKPFGYGDSFTLSNYLSSSPHMLEDSDADGLSDGMALYGSPTPAIVTNRYLSGGQSQKITTASSGDEGIATDTVAVSGVQEIVAFVDVITVGDPVSVILRDDTGIIQSKKLHEGDSTAVSSKSMAGVSPNDTAKTWYRVQLSGNSTIGATTAWVQVRRLTADATEETQIWIDKVYLRVGATVVPPAFSSTRALKNRYDPAIAEANINYLDVWGIPGDVPALADITLTPSSGKATQYIVAAQSDGVYKANAVAHWHDSSGFTSRSGTWGTGSGTINDHYFQCSTTTGALGQVATADTFEGMDNRYAGQVWRVFALSYTSDVDATLQAKYYSGSSASSGKLITQTDVGQLDEASKWKLVDLGRLNLQGVLSPDINFNLSEEFHITQDGGATVRLDGLLYLPSQNGFCVILHYDLTAAAYQSIYIDGADEQAYGASSGIRLTTLGRFPMLTPGNVMNRLMFVVLDGADNEVDITSAFTVALTVTPRTSHLLGVT